MKRLGKRCRKLFLLMSAVCILVWPGTVWAAELNDTGAIAEVSQEQTTPATATYTVTYNLNGGGPVIDPVNVTADTAGSAPLTISTVQPEKAYYVFKGWKLDGELSGNLYQPGSQISINSHATLIAQWEAKRQITYEPGADGVTEMPAEDWVVNGVAFNLAQAPQRAGYRFNGWKQPEGTVYDAGASVAVTQNTVFTAQWVQVYQISFNTGGSGVSIPAAILDTGKNLTWPDNPVWEKHDFLGWKLDGDDTGNLYTSESAYTPDGNKTFTAQWFEWPKIQNYASLTSINVANNLHYDTWDMLTASLPTALTYTLNKLDREDSNQSLERTVDITGWELLENGMPAEDPTSKYQGKAGEYQLRPVYNLPERVQECDNLPSLKIVIQKDQTSSVITDEASGEYTFTGSAGDDVITVSYEAGYMVITFEDGSDTSGQVKSVTTYRLKNKTKVIIDGSGGNDFIYMNASNLPGGLASLEVTGGAGVDTITTRASGTLDWSAADVKLQAENVKFSVTGLMINAASLNICPSITAGADPTSGRTIQIDFVGVTVNTTGSFVMAAQVVDTQPVSSPEQSGITVSNQNNQDADIQVPEQTKTVVKEATVQIKIDGSHISADSIEISGIGKLESELAAGTQAVIQGMKNNVLVTISQAVMNALKDILIRVEANVTITSSGSVISVVSANSTAKAEIDNSTLRSAEGIQIQAGNKVNITNTSIGGDSGGISPPGSIAVTGVTQKTTASALNCTLEGNSGGAAANISVVGIQDCTTNTAARTSVANKDYSAANTMDALLGFMTGLGYSDTTKVLDSNMTAALREKYENALLAAAKDPVVLGEITLGPAALKQVKNQQAGAFAANLVSGTNAAFINGGSVSAKKLDIHAYGKNTNTLKADASGVTVEVNEKVCGIGAAAALNFTTYQNQAYLDGTEVKAADTVSITAGKADDSSNAGISSKSQVAALAGLSKGKDFGIAGAIAMNFYKGAVQAWLKNITHWPNPVGSLTVKAVETSDQETLADGVPNNTEKESELDSALKAGNGAAIAYNVFDNRVQASVSNCGALNTTGAVQVQASSNGKNKSYAYSGSGKLQGNDGTAATGGSLVSSLGMNVLYQEVKAFLQECGTLTVGGKLEIHADTARTVDVLADTQKADADVKDLDVLSGRPTGVDSLALALNIAKLTADANLNASIDRAGGVDVAAGTDYTETIKSIAGLKGQSMLNTAGTILGLYDLVDQLFATAQTVSGLGSHEGVPEKAPLKAKSYEYFVDTASTEALSKTELATRASIGKEAGDSITLKDCGDVNVKSTQTGSFVVIGDGSMASHATIGTSAALGSYTLTNRAEVEKNATINTSGKVAVIADNGTGKVSFNISAGSGTSQNNTTGTGVVVIEQLAVDYLAGVYGNLTAGSVLVKAGMVESSEVAAGSDTDAVKLMLRSKGTGMGAAFSYLDIDGSVKAEAGSDAQITATGTEDSFKVLADYNGDHNVTSQSGEDMNITNQKLLAGKNALDASVALNIFTMNIDALINSGAAVTAANGNLQISSKSKTKNFISATATAKGSSKAAGASVAINLVKVGTHARMSGAARAPKGAVSVKAEAASADDASAYASASGVDVRKYMQGNQQKWLAAIAKGDFGTMGFQEDGEGNVTGGELKEEYRICENTGVASRINNAFGIGLSPFQPLSNALLIKNTIQSYTQQGQKVEKEKNSKMVFAAAFGMNQLAYNTSAVIDGTVAEAGSVEIQAENNNNFRTYGTGLATSGDKAISAAAALLINKSKTEASAKSLGSDAKHIGAVSIIAKTTNNMGVGFPKFTDAIAAQAISGAKTAQSGQDSEGNGTAGLTSGDLKGTGLSDDEINKSSTFGFAGGVAVIISGIETIANLAEASTVFTDGALLIQATEQARLGARGWGGDYSKKDANSNEPKGIGAGIGMALLMADNQIHAYIGNNSNVTAGSVKIRAERLEVNQGNYKFAWELKFNLTFDTDAEGNLKPTVDTNIGLESLMKEFTDGLNYFASCNFYAGAIGGAIASGGSASGAGSFAILVLNYSVTANIEKDVKLTLLNKGAVNVEAISDVFAMTVSGTIDTSGKVGIGASAGVNNATDRAEAYMDNGTTLTNPGEVLVNADTEYLYIQVAAAGVKADKLGISGILILLNGGNTTKAWIGDNFTLTGGSNDVTVSANNNLTFYGIPVGIGFSKNGSGVGATVLVVNMDETISATMGNALNIITNGAVSVKADNNEFLFSVVAGGGYAGKAEVTANAAVKALKSHITASIGSGTITAMNLLVHAKGIVETFAVSADAALSKEVSIGGVNDTNEFTQTIQAYLEGTVLKLSGGLTVEALSAEDIRSYVAGLAASGKTAAQGSVSVQKLNNTVKAYLGENTKVEKVYNVTVSAADTMEFWILAGAAGGSKSAAVGIANADVLLNNTIWAYVGQNVTINDYRDVKILAASTENAKIFVVGGSASGNVAATGSVSVIVIKDQVRASIDKGAEVYADGNVQLKAEKHQDISALVGSVAFSGGTSVGAASNTITIGGTTGAYVEDGAVVNAKGRTIYDITVNDGLDEAVKHQGILLGAYVDTTLKNLVVGGEGAATAAIGASANVIVFEGTTETKVGKATLDSGQDIVAAAVDKTVMDNIVGGVQGAGTVAIGAAVDVITLNKTVRSVLDNGSNVIAAGNIFVTAAADQKLSVIAAGAAGSGNVTVTGNPSVIVSKNNVYSGIGTDEGTSEVYAQAFANGNIVILASVNSDIKVISGAAAVGGNAAVAAGVSTITITDTTTAQTGKHADVTALGNAQAVSFYSGSKKAKKGQCGLMIGAYHNALIRQIVFAASGSGAVALSPASATVVSRAVTTAKIGDYGRINRTSRESHTASHDQGVRVIAVSDSDCEAIDGGAAISGTAGVGAAAIVIVQNKTTVAKAGSGASIIAANNVEILASSYNSLKLNAAGLGGGVVGVSGTADVVLINDTTLASVENGAADHKTTIETDRIAVNAFSEQELSMHAGSAAAGTVGVGASTVVLNFQSVTKALIGDGSDASHVVLKSVQADIRAESSEKATVYVLCGLAGVASVGGSAAVLIMNVTTQALIGNGASVECSQKLEITASDTSEITGNVGNAAGGAAQLGGAVVVILYRNTISAGIQGGTIEAGSISILAKAKRDVDAKALAGGAGLASVNGSVVVISIGASTDDVNTNTALKDTVANAQKDINTSLKDNSGVPGELTSPDITGAMNGITIDLSSLFTGSSLQDKVSAFIAGGTVTATSGELLIQAQDATTVTAAAGAAAAGGVAVGGAVVIVTLKGTTEATGAGSLTSAGALKVLASNDLNMKQMLTVSGSGGLVGLGGSVAILNMSGTTRAALTGAVAKAGNIQVKAAGTLSVGELYTIAGALGKTVGIGAAVAQMNLKGIVSASLDGLTVTEAKAMEVSAQLDVTGKVLNGSIAAAGGAAIGATVVEVNVNTSVEASGSSIRIAKADSLSITAGETISLTVEGYGLAGGIIAGATGTAADVTIQGSVKAYLAGNSSVTTTNDMLLKAILMVNKLDMMAKGAALAGGAAASATLVTLRVEPTVYAYVDNSTLNAGGEIAVLAYYNGLPEQESRPTYNVSGEAGSAAAMAAGSGVKTQVFLNGFVKAYMNKAAVTKATDISVIAYGYTGLAVNSGTVSAALGLGAGASESEVEDLMSVAAYTVNSALEGSGDGYVQAIYVGSIRVNVVGGAGGLLAAGVAQSSVITSNTNVLAKIDGGSVHMGGNLALTAERTINIDAVIKGCAASGFASGGMTKSSITLEDKNEAVNVYITGKAEISAGSALQILASNIIDVKNSGYASAAALGGSVNDVEVKSDIKLSTSVRVAKSCSLTGGSIAVSAKSNKYYSVYASSFAGAIAAFGVSTALLNVDDDVFVIAGSGSQWKATKDISIYTEAGYKKNSTPSCEAKAGKGGLGTNVGVKAEMNQDVTSRIETESTDSEPTVFHALAGDVQLIAQSYLIGNVKASIAFGVDAVSFLNADATMKNNVSSTFDLRNSTEISGVNVTVMATVVQVKVAAETRAETVSALNTQLRPNASMNNTIGTYVNIRANSKLTASGQLLLQAIVEYVSATTYSLGDTKGVTGSVISYSTNNTSVNSNVKVTGKNTELKGRDVKIIATSANEYRNSTVNYSNTATYKAYTASEFIKQTVERVTTVVEQVTEKVCKWLPWPFNLIVKWIVKTVVKVVRWFEEILVEKVLQSKTDAVQKGSFTSNEGIHLEGHIYYGSNAPVDIVIEENGTIRNSDVVSEIRGDTIYIKSFNSTSAGSFTVNAQYGKVDGDVTVHSNALLSHLSITNNSNYHLKLENLTLSSNSDPDSCNYQIIAMDNMLNMTDVTDQTQAPEIIITSTKGKDVIFAGAIKDFAAVFRLKMHGGNIYMESTADVAGNKFYTEGANHIGTQKDPFRLSIYITVNGANQAVAPEIQLIGTGDVFTQITLMRYLDNRNTGNPVTITSLEGLGLLTVKSEGTAHVVLNGAVLLETETATGSVSTEYTYEKSTVVKEKITDEIELYVKYDRHIINGLKMRYNENGDVEYWLNDSLYVIPEGYSIAIVNTAGEKEPPVLEYWLVSNKPIEQYYVYKGTETKFELKENQKIVWQDNTTYNEDGSVLEADDEKGYYLFTIVTEIVKDTLVTNYEDGVALINRPIYGIYHLAVIEGKNIYLSADGEKAKTELWLDGTVTGNGEAANDDVTIQLTNNAQLYVNNVVTSKNGSISVSTAANKDIYVKAGGQLAAENGRVSVNTGSLSTEKTANSSKADVIGKEISLNLQKDGGSASNRLHVHTGEGGISATGENIYLYSQNALTLGNITVSNLADILIENSPVILKAGHTGIGIKAKQLMLHAGTYVGTKEAPVTVSIGTGGMDVSAAGDIFLTQKEQAGYLNNITSTGGNVTVLADARGENGSLYLTQIIANGTADLTSMFGSLIRNTAGACVTAENIRLTAGKDIGSAGNVLLIALGAGELRANAGQDLYLQDQDGNVRIDEIQAHGTAYVKTTGDILKGAVSEVQIAADKITLITDGGVGASGSKLNVQSNNGLNVNAKKKIYLHHEGNANHVNLTKEDDVYFEAEGTILLDSVQAGVNGEAKAEIISRNGDILGCTLHENAVSIIAGTIVLKALNGRIGGNDEGSATLRLALIEGGSLSAEAKGDISLEDGQGAVRADRLTSAEGSIVLKTARDVILGVLRAGEQIQIRSEGSILNGNSDGTVNLTGKSLILQAKEAIGSAEKAVLTDVDSMRIYAGGDIYLKDTNGPVIIGEIISTDGNLNVETAGDAEVIKAEAKSGNITLTVSQSAKLGTLKGNAENGTMTITAAQDIMSRNLTDVWNLLANAIVLNAGGAIGSAGSPVRTDGNTLDAEAEKDIWMTDVNGEVTVHGLKSKTGGITLITNGDTRITSMEADKEIKTTALNGNITLVSLITKQKAAITAAAGSIYGISEQAGVRAKDIVLDASETIGTQEISLSIDLGNGLLTANAKETIYLKETAGDVRVDTLASVNGAIYLETAGAVYSGRTDEGTNLKAKDIHLNVQSLGSEEASVTISTGDGSLYIRADETIWITGQETTLRLGRILVENGDVNLNLKTDCENGLTGEETADRNITAKNLTVNANGHSMGTSELAITTDLSINGALTVTGAQNVYLSEKDALHAKQVIASDILQLTAENGTAYTSDVQGAQITIRAAGQILGEGAKTAYIVGRDVALHAGSGIGQANQYYLVDTADDGTITAEAGNDIYLREVQGDLYVKQMTTSKDIYLNADGGILSGSGQLANLVGANLKLTADQGSIGSQQADLTVKQLDGGSVTAETVNQNICLKAVEGDLNLLKIQAGTEKVSLKAKGSILNGRADNDAVIQAGNLYLETEMGSMGTESRKLYIDLADLGRLDVNAGKSAYLEEKDDSLMLGEILVKGEELYLQAPENIFTALTLDELAAGIANITAKNVHLIAENGQIGQDSNPGQSYLEEDYAGWITTSCDADYLFNAQAYGNIYIREITDSMRVGTIVSETGDVMASALNDLYGDSIEGRDVYVETTKGEISISVQAANDVVINSCGSVSNMNPGDMEGVDSVLVEGNNITLLSREGNIGEKDSYIEIDLGSQGILNAQAYGNIYIREKDGNLNVGRVESKTGDVGLDAVNGSILAVRTDGGWDIFGKNILLTAAQGTIGTEEHPVILESDGTVTMKAQGNIVLTEQSGDLVLDTVVSQEDVILTADGSIRISEVRAEEIPAITGKHLNLIAQEGSLGEKEKPLTLELLDGGTVSGQANHSAYLYAVDGTMNMGVITAPEEIILTSKGNIENAAENGNNLYTAHTEMTSIEGAIGTEEKAVMLYGGTIVAKASGNIYLESEEDLFVQTITSENGAIVLSGKQNIRNGLESGDEGANLIAENITIRSNGSVGEKSRYFVTELLPDAQGVKTGKMNAQADIDLSLRENTGDFIGENLIAGRDVYLGPTRGNMVINNIQAGNDIVIEDTQGSADITAAQSGRNLLISSVGGSVIAETLSAGGDITVRQTSKDVLIQKETTKGSFTVEQTEGNVTVEIGATAGDFTIRTTGGDVTVKEARADSNLKVEGTKGTVAFTQVDAGADLNVTDTGSDVKIQTGKAGQNLLISSVGGSVIAETLSAGGDLTVLQTSGDVTADQLSVGKNLLMESIGGNVMLSDANIIGTITMKSIAGFVDVKSGSSLNISQIDSRGSIKLETSDSVTAADSGTVNGSSLEIKAGGSIGSEAMRLNTAISGTVTMEAGSDIYYKEQGTIRVQKIVAGGTADLTAGSAIEMADAGSYGVEAGNIRLEAGNIGNAGLYLAANITGNGSVNAKASGAAYLFGRNDFRAGQIQAGAAAYIRAGGSIVNAAAGTNVQAGTMNLEAGGAIGAGNALQVQSANISAKAGSLINLASSQTMQITQMQAPVSITLKAAQILGGNITTGTLDMTAFGAIGTAGSLLGTNISVLRAAAGSFAGIRNSGRLTIDKMDAADAVIHAAQLVSNSAVNVGSLELHASNGIGNSIGDAFLANVNSFTGSTDAGSIFFRNSGNMKVSGLKAPAMIYLAAKGKVTGGSNAVASDTFVFDTQGLEIGTNVNAAEGHSSQGVKLANAKALSIGGVSDAYQGIQVQGAVQIQTEGNLTTKENVKTSGSAELSASNQLHIADGTQVTGASAVYLRAGRRLMLAARGGVNTSGSARLEITGSGSTSMQVLGTVKAGQTSIQGGRDTDVIIRSGMGSVDLAGASASSNLYAQVLSLDSSLNIRANGSIKVDAQNTDGQVNFSGSGGNTYELNLMSSGSAKYQFDGNGNLNLHTTAQNENIRVDGNGITVNSQKIGISGLQSVVFNNPGGNNRYDFYDTPCTMAVYSGSGSDTYYIGKLNSGYSGVKTTEGILSPGNSHALTIQDQGGSNHYTIYSALAPLTIHGGSGNDTFEVKAVVQILADGTLVPYQNSEMNLNGGGGSNSIEIIKSALFDRISAKDGAATGSGLNISYDQMDQVAVSKYRPSADAESAWTTWMWIVYSLKQMAENGSLYVILLLLALLAGAIVALTVHRRRRRAAA